MIIATSASIAGRPVTETLGIVRGNTIRARHVGRDILAGLKMLVGGEIHDYTKMMAESREQSIDRMIAEAQALGADAIVEVRFSTSYIMTGAAEILVYGTAVRLGAS
ncbi:heavy metal-binding domain-containing protein [Pseudohongiella sp. SYSU M77423]|uniref:YbjQ family protein n=1 Tax=unclassified Pseudohongiella TaxID=2629611 RepID=UPI001F27EE22|nr:MULTISPECIES: heavy metal-binding domain-containing protein [unclassified Pseudohongiella]MDH7942860.1 heavy metal-binding domain-containing protein [Pseudohongiella sp. SYSU M77423]MEC8860602.1 heavy metal-binding domain-containing protein [Pseudomonadota bacterium]